MGKRAFPLIQTTPVPTGDASWEAKRKAIRDQFVSNIPAEYYIPQDYVDAPPLDVREIPRTCGILTPEELEITENYDATGLAAAIAAREHTSVAVATAFCKRAIVAHQLSCCLTQWFMDEALERARALDEHLDRTGKTVGPLHGVPVSLKEHIGLAGHASSYGFASSTEPVAADAHMVAILRALGAVFYVKTNQPQSLMHGESDSHLGRVLNPYNIQLTAGGSTGGEAALLALRGSVLGVGTDIGGSIRIPAGFCALYGFKPTSATLPMRGYFPHGLPAELNVQCSTGPLCRSLRDMDLFMRLVLAARPHLADPRVLPTPWTGLGTPLAAGRVLKVGLMRCDGVVQPQPPVARALAWAAARLAPLAAVELKPYRPHGLAAAMAMAGPLYFPDGGLGVRRALAAAGEPTHPLTAAVLGLAGSSELTATELSRLRVRRDAFRAAFAQDWAGQDVDVVLCPVFVGPAAAHDTVFYWYYTALWNLVDYPAAVFPTPVRAARRGEEAYADGASEVLGPEDRQVRELWEQTDFEGAPINLQLVARKHDDNLLFGALQAVRDVLGL
ncbi:amidase signature domain-containing protein [Macrophomina phaseolina]|uniref:Amidase signature domain-containing protein n=1 Tax=Macrophomina phaseolina TaxID=35725 RepID=A0ABQ8FPH5_9PEZI|nr:amidase signature domain-containing protein [Macrophomina phaseolina]